ncbi:Subtilisin DY [bacterium HR09]|nr:Subtilisin DY [bacterium HR09]
MLRGRRFGLASLFFALLSGFVEAEVPLYEAKARLGPVASPPVKKARWAKLDRTLNAWLEAQEARKFAQQAGLRSDGDAVQVYVVAAQGAEEKVQTFLTERGCTKLLRAENIFQCFADAPLVRAAAEQPEVLVVRVPSYYRPAPWETQIGLRALTGSMTTEALTAMNVPAWHSAGIQGQGVKVGVIDAGFTGYESLVGSDLPPSDRFIIWPNGSANMANSEHGTMCAEIVADIVPQATMYVAAIATEVDIVNAIQWMQSQGVKVITMSLGWLSWGPGDGTGTLATAVNNFVSSGGFWANSAGNSRLAHWQGNLVDSNGNGFLEFDGAGLEVNYITDGAGNCVNIPAQTSISASLVWNQWNAPQTDLDFYIVKWDAAGSQWVVLGKSEDTQNGQVGQRPVEENFDVATTNEETCYGFAIKYYSGPTNVQLEFFNRFDGNPLKAYVGDGSLTPPADASGAVATAALHVATLDLEPYSSKGPTNGPGGALNGGSVKPDLSGYAKVSCNAYGANQCSGTSAASPHVGGAAALVLSGYPTYSGSQIRSYLESNAQDMGPGGKDNDFGYGRLRLGTPPASTCTTPGTPSGLASSKSSVLSGETFTLSWAAASLADSYELQFANNSGFSGAQSYDIAGTSTGFQVTTTSAMTAYFRVRAKRTCGATGNWSNTVQVSVSPSGGGGGGSNVYWIPVVANAPGQGSYFYSDVMVLNVGTASSAVAFTYYPAGQTAVGANSATPIPAGGQGIFRDIVGQLNKAGTKGVLKVEAPQPLKVFSRTYNKLAAGNSLGLTAGTTFGQGMEAYSLADTLSAGQSAYLVGLTQNAFYSTNIAVANFGTAVASVTVTLYSGSGAQLATYNVNLNPGELKQEDQVFVSKAGQSNLESGWAKVTVTSGSGVVAYASVLDNVATGGQKPSDPTTIPFKR